MKCLGVLLFVTALGPQAFGDDLTNQSFFIAPGVFYSSGIKSRTSKDEKIELRAELKAAYQVYPNVFVGPVYAMDQESTKTSGYSSASLNNTSKGNRQSYGAAVGYVTTTYHLFVNYLVNSTWTLDTTTSTGSTKYVYKGNGFQFDLAYKIPIWGLYFGPQLSYKILTYSKLSTDGGPTDSITPKLEDTGLEPSIVLYWFF